MKGRCTLSQNQLSFEDKLRNYVKLLILRGCNVQPGEFVLVTFEESDIPIRVDVLDWHMISPEFQSVINKGYEVIQPAQTNPNPAIMAKSIKVGMLQARMRKAMLGWALGTSPTTSASGARITVAPR